MKSNQETVKATDGVAVQESEALIDPSREEAIRRRAYEIYLEHGGDDGHDIEHWLQAKRELTAD